MEIKEYINKKKELHNLLLKFIESANDDHEELQKLIQLIKQQKIQEDYEEFKALLHLIAHISTNHYRHPDFFSKIEQIISNFQSEIKQTFSNFELFDIFKRNKRILLFLFTEKYLILDKSIILTFKRKEFSDFYYEKYFSKENEKEKRNKTDEEEEEEEEEKEEFSEFDSSIFERRRQLGENDSYLCQLIRNDSIDDFVIYVNQTNLSLSSQIKHSIFETNPFLLQRSNTTLIEYAAFFGSLSIFKFLKMNGVELKPSLWLYAIHGHNAELIHLLEENQVNPDDFSYQQCLIESIKCHHNDIAVYIQDNLLNANKLCEKVIESSFHYYNYLFFPDDFNNKFIISCLCQYNYVEPVKILFKTIKFDLNEKIILIFFFSNNISF